MSGSFPFQQFSIIFFKKYTRAVLNREGGKLPGSDLVQPLSLNQSQILEFSSTLRLSSEQHVKKEKKKIVAVKATKFENLPILFDIIS